jgi:hypothetical protein
MSTYFTLICEDHKEKVDAASRTIGGYCPLAEGPVCLVPFIIAHAGCHVEIVSEHDERSWSDDYFEWTEANLAECLERAYARGRWGVLDTDARRESDYKGRCEDAEQAMMSLEAALQSSQKDASRWNSEYMKLRETLKNSKGL